jgi:serine protease Do
MNFLCANDVRSLLLSIVALTGVAAAQLHADDLVVPTEVLDSQQTRVQAIAKATKVSISVFGPAGAGGGSGVVITPDGYALTNFHVAKPCGNAMKCSMNDGVLYDAVIVGIDPVGDVALIKLLGRDDFPCADIANSDNVQVGDWCFAVGNPFLLATDFNPTVTFGIVSGTHRYQYPAGTLLEYADCIQTDASINPGNSGGPLFNADGNLIGINGRGSFEKRGRVNVGVGYAISINQIQNFMGYLRSGRILDHATLGATVSTDEDGRVVVSNILASSDAYRRGLRYGDEIVRFGGREIGTVNTFKNVLGIYPKGWRVPITFRRNGQVNDVLVRLTGVHSRKDLLAKIQGKPKPQAPKPAPKKNDDKEDPKGDDKGDDKDAEGEKPKLPIPKIQLPKIQLPKIQLPKIKLPGKPGVPANVAKLLDIQEGYANFYFNKLNQDRVWNAMTKHGDFKEFKGTWLMQGALTEGGKVRLELGDDKSTSVIGVETSTLTSDKDYSDQLGPPNTGGFLAAAQLWRRLLTKSHKQFGDIHYLGTAPLIHHEGLYDVYVGIFDVVETRFYFDPETGLMTGIEMYPDSDIDPCEVFLADYREVDGRSLPHKWTIRYRNDIFGVIQFDKFELAKTEGAAP